MSIFSFHALVVLLYQSFSLLISVSKKLDIERILTLPFSWKWEKFNKMIEKSLGYQNMGDEFLTRQNNINSHILQGPFLWMGFNCLKATATSRRQFTFYHSVPRNSWYSFYRPRKDERLSRPWSHPVVLNTGPLDWESSALATWPLLHEAILPF